MRLTLRTLLAYLDDRLAPANARELGQKVTQSPFATELADRIREVVRRRRLANESPTQKTIDANLIAEYLDDQLTPELVALIEKEILSSDHSLAEVAASHQIIGMLNDPVEISDTLKQRLYKLDPALQNTEDGETPSNLASSGAVEWKPLTAQVVPQKRSPMLLLLVMVLGWLLLLATDSNLFRSRPDNSETFADAGDADPAAGNPNTELPAAADAPAAVAAAVPDDASAIAQPKAGGDAAPLEALITAAEQAVAPPTKATGESITSNVQPIPPADSASPKVAATKSTPDGETPAMKPEPAKPAVVAAVTDTTNTSTPPAAETVPSPPDTPAIVTKPAEIFELQDPHSMLIYASDTTVDWQWASALGVAPGGDWNKQLTAGFSGIPEPFSVSVNAPAAGWRTLILGDTLFRAVDGPVAGIELLEGRMVLSRGAAEEPRTFLLRAGGRSLTIDLPADGKRIGVLVVPQSLPADDAAAHSDDESPMALLPLSNSCKVFVYAAESDVVLRVDADPQPVTMKSGATLAWDIRSDERPTPTAPAITSLPEWIFQSTAAQTEAMEEMITSAAEEFHSHASMIDGVTALAGHRNPELAAYAVKVPALTRNVIELTSYLIQSEEESVQREAIIGLQRIVRQTPLGRSRVQRSMGNRLSEMEVDIAMRVLEGVTATAAEDAYTSSWLVEMLNSNRVALRALAIFTLEELTEQRYGYFPHDDGGRREASVRRWKRLLDRNNGRLIKPAE